MKTLSPSIHLLAVAMAIAVLATSQPAAAQGLCGNYCHSGTCGWDRYTGYDESPGGSWQIGCTDTQHCDFCFSPSLISERSVDQRDVSDILRDAPAHEVRAMVMLYQDRLLIHPQRNILAIRGSDCDAELVTSVVFVSPERMALLEELGLPSLNDHLERTRTVAARQ